MIDKQTLRLLDSLDPDERIAGVKLLARSNDPEGLKYLAALYKSDNDPVVRDMALKAGRYLKKQLADAPPAPPPSYDTTADVRARDTDSYEISDLDKERARGLVEQAVNLHMRDENAKALVAIKKALQTDPTLKDDDYTVRFAATITGRPSSEAIAELMEDVEKGHARHRKRAAARAESSPLHATMAIMVMAGVVIVLLGYFAMAWADLGAIETTDELTGQTTTLDEQLDMLREQMDQLAALGGGAELNRIINAVNALKFSFTGWETTSVALGMADPIDVMGMRPLFDLMGDLLGTGDVGGELESPPANPDPMDYSMLLVPIGSIALIVMGILLLATRNTSLLLWGITMIIAIVMIIPFVYFYLESSGDILGSTSDLGAFGEVPDLSNINLIGVGYIVSVTGLIIVVLMPLAAFLIPPPSATVKAKNDALA